MVDVGSLERACCTAAPHLSRASCAIEDLQKIYGAPERGCRVNGSGKSEKKAGTSKIRSSLFGFEAVSFRNTAFPLERKTLFSDRKLSF
jgi:hypothetical protein